MPTITIITDNTPDQINGVVTTYRNIRLQAECEGYRVEEINPTRFANLPAPGYPEVRLSWPWRIGELIAETAPDYVHIATEGTLGLAARLWLDRQGWRYNTSYHTRFPEFMNTIYGIPTGWTYRYLRWFHKHSGRVLTTTSTMVTNLQQHGFTGEILAWTRGVDRNNLQPTQDWSHNHSYRHRPRVLCVSRVSAEKNLEAVCELAPEFDVHVVGDGPALTDLRQRYPGITYYGYLTGSDLADQYAQADVFAFPSRADTFGIVMIEAMSLGTPVAAYPVPGPQDVVMPGITGILDFDLARAVRQCLALDRDQIRQHSQRWSWQACWQIFKSNLVFSQYHQVPGQA
jgi:glycosyltransferase involved in cell wall biosynthesis